jgi:ABC-type spermidine/putrescine transport system permease subunit I
VLAYCRSLLAGPAGRAGGRAGIARIVAVAPLVLLAAAMAGAAAAGLAGRDAGELARCLGLAAIATLACLALAVPAALARPGWAWLAPAWLGAGAGWSLLPLPAGGLAHAFVTAAALLPVAVLCLAGGAPGLSTAERRAAASLGADGPSVLRRLVPRAVWPGVWRAGLLVFVLSAGLLLRGR